MIPQPRTAGLLVCAILFALAGWYCLTISPLLVWQLWFFATCQVIGAAQEWANYQQATRTYNRNNPGASEAL